MTLAGKNERLDLMVGERRIVVEAHRPLTVGRSEEVDVVVSDLRVSRRHLEVRYEPQRGWVLADLGSSSGTFLDGERITEVLVDGVVALRLGDARVGPTVRAEPLGGHVIDGESVPDLSPPTASTRPAPGLSSTVESSSDAPADHAPSSPSPLGSPADSDSSSSGGTEIGERITIGRAADNDVVLTDLVVSRHHAVVERIGTDGWRVEDLDSENGTFVDGVSVQRAPLADRQIFSIAQLPLQLRDGRVHLDPGSEVPALQCEQAGVVLPGGLRILDGVSFRADAGTLTAVLGPTGAGKSTLLKILTGARRPSEGEVLIEGRDLHAAPDEIRPMLGYVPQDDILHPQLSVRRALTFGAELRLPPDVSPDEIDRRVDEVLRELGLSHRGDVQISHLSGGQRKRTSVALELLTAPRVLFLDEPTSGLDPGYEKSVMQLLRGLADAGRTVVAVTHSVQSLDLCDRVLFLAAEGRTAFLGAPEEVLNAFGKQEYAGVFQALEKWTAPPPSPPAMPPQRIDEGFKERRAAPDPRDPVDRERWLRQLSTLVRRQCAVVAGDRRVLLYFLAAVLVPALLVLAVVDAGALDPEGDLPSASARTLLGALVVAAVAIGAANTLREIVKERAIFSREYAAGVADTAYIASKVIVFGIITTIQAALLVVIATSTAGGPSGSSFLLPGRIELAVAVVLAALGAATMGLLLSSLVSSSEKAMALISIVFVVQWLLSGVALDLHETPVVRPVTYLTSANWGMAAAASTADLARLELNCEHLPDPDVSEPDEQATSPQEGGSEGTLDGQPAADPVDERRCDVRWERGALRWLLNVCALLVLAAAPLPLIHLQLKRASR